MALLKRDDILKAPDIKTELVAVPEWGGEVLVRGMTGAERDAFEADVVTQRGRQMQANLLNVRAKMAAATMVDETGARMFTEADVEELGAKSAAALQRVFDVAQRLSGLSQADVDELAKN